MAEYRKKIDADPAGFSRLISRIEKEKFFTTDDWDYKRISNPALDESLNKWYRKKGIDFTRYEDYSNTAVYGTELVDVVFDGFKKLYPLYKFFESIKVSND
jgi:hypothetical protein